MLLVPQEHSDSRRRWLISAGLVFLTLVLYWPVTRFEFLNFDDPVYVTKNQYVLNGLTFDGIKWAFTAFATSNWHPLTWLSHMLDCTITTNPGTHHFINLLFHIANTVLLFIILNKTTASVWKCAIVAALFAWHPLHVESVAWVAERKDVLSTFLGMLALLCYIFYTQSTVGKSKVYYGLSLAMFALGLMSKPMLVTLPLWLLLLDLWPLQRFRISSKSSSAHEKTFRQVVFEKIPFFTLTLISCVVTFMAQKAGGSVMELESLPLSSRLMNALLSYTGYLAKTVWPFNLSVFYPLRTEYPIGAVALAALILLAISLLSIFSFRRAPYILVGWLWFLGTLIPVIGLVQVGSQAMADRYSYVPLIGIFITVVWGVTALWNSRGFRTAGLGLLALAALTFCFFVTSIQIRYWKDSATLFQHALNVCEQNPLAHHNLAEELSQHGNQREAIVHYRRALALQPVYPSAHLNLGNSLNLQGDSKAAIQEYLAALAQKPDYAKAHFILASTFAMQNQMADAEVHFKAAIKSDPTYASAHLELGNLLLAKKRNDEALDHLNQAVQLQPENADAQYYFAYALAMTRHFSEAIEHYQQALKINPQNSTVLNDLAWILATEKPEAGANPETAIQLAKRACALTQNREVRYINTLAHAYAAAGQIDQAILSAQMALDLASASKDFRTADLIRQQLESWQKIKNSTVK